jgi:TonB-dependent starch-binding outer membrane protein SusC
MRNQLRLLLLTAMVSLFMSAAWAQTGTITGKVSDSEGEFIVGANVYLQGTTIGTTSDVNGLYILENVPAGDVNLVISMLSYGTEVLKLSVKASQTTKADVILKTSSFDLSETVVVGYGVQRKSDLTGSVSVVGANELKQLATVNVAQSLQGRVAGVQVISNSGEPGAGMKVRVRGIGTLNSSDPLYVVDGIPTGNISHLTPNDIEKMEVLKDASATAIYGSRGANGVIMITTRKGTAGKGENKNAEIEFSSFLGVQQAWKQLELTNAAEYATLRLEAYANDGAEPSIDLKERLQFVKDGNYVGTDWQNVVFRPATIQNHALTVRGGTEKNRYLLSGAFYDQDGIVENSNLQKVFLRFNNENEFLPFLRGGVNASYTNAVTTNYNGDLYSGVLPGALRADPVTPAWDEITNNYGRADLSYIQNPKRIIDESRLSKSFDNRFFNTVYAELDLVKGLSFKSQLGFDFRSFKHTRYLPEYFITTDESRTRSDYYEKRAEGKSWVWSNFFNYNNTFGDHNFNAMAGTESQYSEWKEIAVNAFDVPLDETQHYLSASQDLIPLFSSYQSESSIVSYFGRVNYSYKNRYLFTGTIRRDGSSKFTDEFRWGVFPSFSIGWNLREEAFMSQLEWLTSLKIRGSYGKVGNESSVGNYAYVTTVTSGNFYTFNGVPVPGSIPTSLSNPEIQWETTTSTNFGFDALALDGRVSLSMDYFIKNTTDMLLRVPIPNYVGAEGPYVNAGEMMNKGLELALGYRNFDHALKYDIGANFTMIKNEVTSLAGGEPIESGSISKVGNTTRTEEGFELAYFYGLRTDGIFNTQDEVDAHINADGGLIQPSAKPGDVKFLDLNEDGLISDKDRTYLGSATPDFTYGFSANFDYKSFDLRLFVQGSYGNEIVNAMTRFLQSSSGWENSVSSRLERWTTENTGSNVPRMTDKDLNKNIERFSDIYVEDGSYVRLKNIQVGYTLPKTWASKVGVKNLRVYISADNLLTFTKYTGFDPEIGDYYYNPLYYGIDVGNYPVARTILGGLNINL